MPTNKKLEKLEKIFTNIFKIKNKKKINNLSMQNCKNWDSLSHLRLILEIEKNFKYSFNISKVPNLKSFKIISLEIMKKN
jgi:acyl carrier protein